MPASNTYNDGGLEHGSALLTVRPKAAPNTPFSAIADSEFSFDDQAKSVDQTNQFGEYAQGFGIPQKTEGSCTVQLPAGSRIYAGDTFTLDIVTALLPVNTILQITKASNPFEKEGYRKQAISYFKRAYALDNSTLQT